MKMKFGMFGLILLFLLGIVFLTGCQIVLTTPDCCTPPITPPIQTCSLTVTAGDYVWGTIYVNDLSTGQYVHYQSQPTATVSVPCNQYVKIYIIDSCGAISHTEIVYIYPGTNYLYFAYWTEDYNPWWKTKNENDCHCKS